MIFGRDTRQQQQQQRNNLFRLSSCRAAPYSYIIRVYIYRNILHLCSLSVLLLYTVHTAARKIYRRAKSPCLFIFFYFFYFYYLFSFLSVLSCVCVCVCPPFLMIISLSLSSELFSVCVCVVGRHRTTLEYVMSSWLSCCCWPRRLRRRSFI